MELDHMLAIFAFLSNSLFMVYLTNIGPWRFLAKSDCCIDRDETFSNLVQKIIIFIPHMLFVLRARKC